MTVVRAQEGTTARAFNTNTDLLRVTSGGLTVLSDLDEILPDQSSANGQVLTSASGTAGFAAPDVTNLAKIIPIQAFLVYLGELQHNTRVF